jgi:hypothetical protein
VNVRLLLFAAVKASASRIVNLTKPDFSHAAARFLRWRKKKWKPPKRKVKRIWVR